ncbi:enolase C-terminal domain-like protein [Stieleria varia]|uniref:L-fuconate dehydratase n=1 Tax=Stieleria varia TaxID=2528005 RepID=A0A5C6B109_9BACT|nr:enolase C-terminal domain-like protein [Stieleria varia]TWU05600.1 L-fuconate dehydratase [Stieleria varia]
MPLITHLSVRDIRFPTSDGLHGSDAIHADPDYSCAYVTLHTDVPGLSGDGITFTLGRGTQLCVAVIEQLQSFVVGRSLESITGDFANWWRAACNESQLRWLGPERGLIHMSFAAIVNAVWDLYAKSEGKPLWKLLSDMTPDQLVSVVDFRHISDVLTPDEAIELLKQHEQTKAVREAELLSTGLPAYTTSAGWIGYSDDYRRELCQKYLDLGFRHFKLKVGANLADDMHRATILREEIGDECALMMDANQVWDVGTAIDCMKELAAFQPLWIEEPTSPDDVLGHAKIARAIAPIGVATGEAISNRVMFKQFLESGAMQFCQIDSCRVGGVNELIAIMLMATKFNVPVCPHAGGVGLCNYIQHLSAFNYIAISPSLDKVVLEYSDHLHEHFVDRLNIQDARYRLPTMPGYSITMHDQSLAEHEFPQGSVWRSRKKGV